MLPHKLSSFYQGYEGRISYTYTWFHYLAIKLLDLLSILLNEGDLNWCICYYFMLQLQP
jgi:hypothetical protein